MSIYLDGNVIGEMIDCTPTISANTVVSSFPSLNDMVSTIQKNSNKLIEYKLNIDTSAFDQAIALVDTSFYANRSWILTEDNGYLSMRMAQVTCVLTDYTGSSDLLNNGEITLSFVPLAAIALYPSESLYPSNVLYPLG
jgi:hypothetical protein